jgi:hypothetical protein
MSTPARRQQPTLSSSAYTTPYVVRVTNVGGVQEYTDPDTRVAAAVIGIGAEQRRASDNFNFGRSDVAFTSHVPYEVK